MNVCEVNHKIEGELYFMSIEALDLAVNSALKKRAILQSSIIKYLLSAVLAGVYIGFGIIVSYRLGEAFYDVHSPATYLMSSLFCDRSYQIHDSRNFAVFLYRYSADHFRFLD